MAKTNRENSEGIISENTPIRIGLILGFVSVLTLSVWWAATITAKLDSIIAFQSSTSVTITELKAQDISIMKDIADIHMKTTVFELQIKDLQDLTDKKHQTSP
jgi:hypothetical protein